MRLVLLTVLSTLVGCSTTPRVVTVPVPSAEGTAEAAPSYTVTGTATISAIPDVAELSVVLSSEQKKPKEAAASVRQSQQSLIDALTATGLPASDIAVSRLMLSPIREPIDEHGLKTRLRGYEASVTVTITTRDFELLPDLMELAAGSGATNVSSSFRVDDLPGLKARAREEAARMARKKAESMASALGVTLGPIRAIVETDGGVSSWQGNFFSNSWSGQVPANFDQVSAQAQEMTMSVSVTYGL